ncbi:MAG: holo-[acyl-carrier-protein] synthase [Chlorobium sp.]|nr:MAG: holo-[acyl-carrier-protein] synthase [Chlorobium sp.]
MICNGIGVDIVAVDRIRNSYERGGKKFLKKILTGSEIMLCSGKADMIPRVAVRFAAKEALAKALGSGIAHGYNWHSVEILNDKKGKPFVKILDNTLAVMAESIKISLSYKKKYAVAFVVIEIE